MIEFCEEANEVWETLEYKSLDGWGEDPKKIEAVIKDDAEAAQMFRDAMLLERGGDHTTDEGKANHNNVIDCLPSTQGNSKAYTLSRLKRENEELFEAVVAGELSVNAAAIKAGSAFAA